MMEETRPAGWKLWIYNILMKIKKILNQFIYSINPPNESSWNFQFKSGKWDHMGDLDQLAHYSIIIGYQKELKYGGSILDVGCGDGILHRKMNPESYSKFVGIDISSEAIKRAKLAANNNSEFISEEMENYNTNEKFDVIIFNESIYYSPDSKIDDLIKKYQRFLKDDGIFIISMFQHRRSPKIWRIVEENLNPIDKTLIKNTEGTTWICEVLTNKN